MVEKSQAPVRRGNKAIAKTIAYTILFSGVILSGWTVLRFFRFSSLQGLITESAQLGISSVQIELGVAGLMGLLASLALQKRRRSRRTRTASLRTRQMTFETGKPAHPLMMIPRPARDKKFVIKKTRNPGRISRNRMGERLPPSYVSPEVEPS